ncbi:MAG: glutaredoxin [Christensenellaceae bacterium]|jgi:glutaredoxin-related protein|nr:glutaredoxin [Christensenellaceae bacterium]
METIKVYGTLSCPDTAEAIEELERAWQPYELIDILASLKNLKAFLNIRDQNPGVFAGAVASGGIGIPAFYTEESGCTLELSALRLKGEE